MVLALSIRSMGVCVSDHVTSVVRKLSEIVMRTPTVLVWLQLGTCGCYVAVLLHSKFVDFNFGHMTVTGVLF